MAISSTSNPRAYLRDLRRLYGNESLATRLHVLGRALLCPFFRLLPYFPSSGRILDIGCGHGVFLNLLACDTNNKGRTMVGVDHDPSKIDVAKRCSVPEATFLSGSLNDMPGASFDAISIIDVLYTIDTADWAGVIDASFCLLKPGGILVVKEVVDTPRWKYWCILLEEKLAVGILKITKGERPHIESATFYRKAIEKSGFCMIENRPLASRWWPISHHLFVARKAKI
jgi:2-polyprenyl-3-methyl-5-hydroxy-6-metoxy-1,4-benzoquinol methylase